jgi:site-specific DNA-adenine methylase
MSRSISNADVARSIVQCSELNRTLFTPTNRRFFEDKQLILPPQLTGQKFGFQNMVDYPQEKCLVYLDPPYYGSSPN